MELQCPGWNDYELLDCGNGLRLERVGPYVISRQAAQAIWEPTLSKESWNEKRHLSHYRLDQGPGKWTTHQPTDNTWPIQIGKLTVETRQSPFGHVGFFPEQQAHWEWIDEQLTQREAPKVLNLFGYTGSATLTAAAAGAHVTHIDAAASTIKWARHNAQLSGLKDAPVRWIADDALAFCHREKKRDNAYDAIILDPPTFGRGPKGQVWKLERSLTELMAVCVDLLTSQPAFMLLTAHTPGVTAAVLQNFIRPVSDRFGGRLQSGDMVQMSTHGPHLMPAGVYCRWLPESKNASQNST
jgi:23S rRNA (cytosine1962-C5)-methyltransferase